MDETQGASTATAMSPAEAAAWLAPLRAKLRLSPYGREALDVLIDHARYDEKGRGPEYRRGVADGRLAELADPVSVRVRAALREAVRRTLVDHRNVLSVEALETLAPVLTERIDSAFDAEAGER